MLLLCPACHCSIKVAKALLCLCSVILFTATLTIGAIVVFNSDPSLEWDVVLLVLWGWILVYALCGVVISLLRTPPETALVLFILASILNVFVDVFSGLLVKDFSTIWVYVLFEVVILTLVVLVYRVYLEYYDYGLLG